MSVRHRRQHGAQRITGAVAVSVFGRSQSAMMGPPVPRRRHPVEQVELLPRVPAPEIEDLVAAPGDAFHLPTDRIGPLEPLHDRGALCFQRFAILEELAGHGRDILHPGYRHTDPLAQQRGERRGPQ